ncbi:MAG: DUF4834 family protein [Gilvibacter sp.]
MLRTLLIIVLVLLGLRLLAKLLAPYIMRSLAKKIEKRFDQNFGAFNAQGQPGQGPPEKEGSVHVTSKKATPNKAASKVGDYIDYEEID